MRKIIIKALLSVMLLKGTLASAPSPAFNGIYAGGALAFASGDINNKISYSNGSIDATTRGVGVNGFLGYGAIMGGSFYLGGELGLGYDASRFNNKRAGTGAYSSWKFKSASNLTYSVAGRLGFAYLSILPYLKLGFEGHSEVKLKDGNGTTVSFDSGDNVKVSRNGFIFGGGIDYALTSNVFVRAEYIHNFGTSSSYTQNRAKKVDFRTPTDTILIGAGYRY